MVMFISFDKFIDLNVRDFADLKDSRHAFSIFDFNRNGAIFTDEKSPSSASSTSMPMQTKGKADSLAIISLNSSNEAIVIAIDTVNHTFALGNGGTLMEVPSLILTAGKLVGGDGTIVIKAEDGEDTVKVLEGSGVINVEVDKLVQVDVSSSEVGWPMLKDHGQRHLTISESKFLKTGDDGRGSDQGEGDGGRGSDKGRRVARKREQQWEEGGVDLKGVDWGFRWGFQPHRKWAGDSGPWFIESGR